ncbi:MAG: response regulator transcription factor [Pelobium sp.]
MGLNSWIRKWQSILLYGSLMAILLFLLKWLEWRFIILTHGFEVYAGCLAIIFTLLGIWLSRKLFKPKTETLIVETQVLVKTVQFILDELEMGRLGLSKRELEVLQLMAEGLSNEEIASKLFVSLNTVKTHSSNVYDKLQVRRRTHAVDRARKLSLIP